MRPPTPLLPPVHTFCRPTQPTFLAAMPASRQSSSLLLAAATLLLVLLPSVAADAPAAPWPAGSPYPVTGTATYQTDCSSAEVAILDSIDWTCDAGCMQLH